MKSAVALAAIATLLLHPAPAAQRATFTSRVKAVRVDVLVTAHGRPVPGLGADAFEVRDNGVLQEVELATFEQVPLNLVLALDVSASVTGERLAHLQRAVGIVLRDLADADQSALVTFSHAVVVHGGLTHDIEALEQALSRVEPEGATALLDALQVSIVVGESEVGRPLVLVFSDGVDTASWLTRGDLLRAARQSDAVVYGVTARGEAAALRDLADATGGSVLDVTSTADLARAFRAVLDEFRHRYLVSYTPAGVPPGGWHTISVKLRNPPRGVRVKARPGYLGDAR